MTTHFERRFARHVAADLEPGEVLSAAIRVQLRGTSAAQLSGASQAATLGTVARVDVPRLDRSRAQAVSLDLASAPFLALGLTNSRLLVYRRSSLLRILKEQLSSFRRETVSYTGGRNFGRRGQIAAATLYFDDRPLELEVFRSATTFLDRLGSTASSEIPEIRVTLRSVASPVSDKGVWMTFSVESASRHEICVYQTPLEGFTGNILDVRDEAGDAAGYRHRQVKRSPPGPEDFVVLRPDEAVTATFDLSEFYDLSSGGVFRVRFRGNEHTNGLPDSETLEVIAN